MPLTASNEFLTIYRRPIMRGGTATASILTLVFILSGGTNSQLRAQSLFERLAEKIGEAAERNAELQESRQQRNNRRNDFDEGNSQPQRSFYVVQPPAAPAPAAPGAA